MVPLIGLALHYPSFNSIGQILCIEFTGYSSFLTSSLKPLRHETNDFSGTLTVRSKSKDVRRWKPAMARKHYLAFNGKSSRTTTQ